MQRIPRLREKIEDTEGAAEDLVAEVEELSRTVPRLISILAEALRERSDLRHRAALSQMITGLTLELDQLRPLAVSLIVAVMVPMSHTPDSYPFVQFGTQLRTACVTEHAKLHHIRATAHEKFLRTIEVA